MGRTINGKELSQIVTELTRPIPKTAEFWGGKDERGNFYPTWIKGEAYEKRFNEIVGPLNYSREPSPISIVELDGKLNATCHMKVTIYDDDGNVVCIKGANGSNETGNGDLKSNYASAETEAFKHLCQDMGIGAGQQDFVSRKEKINGSKSSEKEQAPAAGKPAAAGTAQSFGSELPKGSTHVRCRLVTAFGGNGSFISAQAVDESGRTVLVKVFRNKFAELSKTLGENFEDFARNLPPNAVFSFSGEYKLYEGKVQVNVWGLE